MSNPDAIIIGTGVIGTATAFELVKAGYKTLSLDRNTAIGHGSTAGSCAIIRMHYSTFDGTAMAWEGYHYWRDWADHLGLPEGADLARFIEIGCLVMKSEANGHLETHKGFSAALGIPFEDWSPDEIKVRMPLMDLHSFFPAKRADDPAFGEPTGASVAGGVFWPKAGYVTDPALSAQNLGDAARLHGAEFRLGVEVTEILQENGRVKGVGLANGEEIHAPIVVNVAGPGSNKINAMAGVIEEMTIETRPLRHEVTHVPAPADYDVEAHGMIISDSDIAGYCRPESGGNLILGSEDPPCDDHHWVDSDTDFDRNFTEQWRTQAMRQAQRMPSLGIPSRMKGVVDLYDAATDWIPIYDKSSLGGYYMACGTSGNQYKNAPIAGKLMAALIDYCEAGTDHDTAPLKYTMPKTGIEIDAGFYSRKRAVNTASSMSVLG